MSEQGIPLSRRRFLAGTTWGAIAAATGSMAAPSVLRAQGAGVKVGVLHPVTGALSYSGQQGRIGAMLAVEEINATGGIKALAAAKIDAMLGDAQSTPDGGTAEVEKMNAAEVSCIVGGIPRRSVSRSARPPHATICPMSSTSASPTASSPAASRTPSASAPASGSSPRRRSTT